MGGVRRDVQRQRRGLIRALYEHYGQRLIVFFGGNAARQASELAETGVHTEPLTTRNMAVNGAVGYMKSAAVMVVDNYVAELAAIPESIEVYQIWHAAGAIKNFGWDDPATSQRPAADQRRFQEVYNHFTHIVVVRRRWAPFSSAPTVCPRSASC